MATTVRLTRVESQARTRDDLLAAARAMFLERGFHRASLEQIAEEAGYSKGAVYSNFAGKDDLFLEVLERNYTARVEAYEAIMLAGTDAEETFRNVARFMFEAYSREPAWWPLVGEFSTHASQDPVLTARLRAARERFMESVARTIEQLAERHELTLALPPREVARGSGALLRGMAVEWQIDPASTRAEVFEELFAGQLRGLVLAAPERSTA
jgi:AcrR family transcriptional regulator